MKILNAQGKPVLLTKREQAIANALQKKMIENALGFEINIATLTTIIKKVTEQKFFEINPADAVPIRVGNGSWSADLTTYLSFNLADDFSTGVVNTGGSNGRLATADAGVSALSVPVLNWAKTIGWTLPELHLAQKSGNWDLITAKEAARKKNWDLGIQSIAFLGLSGDSNVLGLFTQSGVTVDTTTIPQSISSLGAIDLKQFVTTVLNVYRSNCNRTAWPTHFVMPESDYLGLVGQASADFPIKSTLELLQEAFAIATKNPGFKIICAAYGDTAYSGKSYQQYALYNYDDASLRMDIPVDYTNTMANTLDSYAFQNVGYGQFTGVLAYRPLEMIYFRYTP